MKNVKFSRNGVEFEPTKQELKIVLDDFAKQVGERDKRIADLERQLAEKEKAHMEAMGNALNDFLTLRQELNQAKTDFAIEQLENVRNEIDKADNAKSYFEGMEKWSKDKRDYFDLGFSDCQSCIWDVVDWQIHELKGEKNV